MTALPTNKTHKEPFDNSLPFFNSDFVLFIKQTIENINDLEKRSYSKEKYKLIRKDIASMKKIFEKDIGIPYELLKECINWGDSIVV